MKAIGLALSTVLLFAAGLIGYAQSQPGGTDAGIESVDVIKSTATVEKVDLEHRKVTLLLQDGKKKTYKVGNDVQNLDQVQVGDRLKMAYTEELLIAVGKSNQAPAAASAGEVAVAQKGDKPGVVEVDTTAVSAKVLAVNPQKHQVTLLDPDGKKKTIKVSSKITNLDQLQPGETVDMVMTESLVVQIVK
jgi:Cu/Ag efflux protein CusF